jgi:hypothetical protein
LSPSSRGTLPLTTPDKEEVNPVTNRENDDRVEGDLAQSDENLAVGKKLTEREEAQKKREITTHKDKSPTTNRENDDSPEGDLAPSDENLAVRKKNVIGREEVKRKMEEPKKQEEAKKTQKKTGKIVHEQIEEEKEHIEEEGDEIKILGTEWYPIPVELSGMKSHPIYVNLLGFVSDGHSIHSILTNCHCRVYPTLSKPIQAKYRPLLLSIFAVYH